jgi:hypothetical protein
LVEVKIRSANLDLENDQLACKLQQKSDMIKMLSERITALEVETLKAKQELGEALNLVYEYEQTNADKQIITQDTMRFGGTLGSGSGHNESGGSGNE